MSKYEFDAADAANEVDDIEIGCRRLTEQIELADTKIDELTDEVDTLNARIAELESELEAANE